MHNDSRFKRVACNDRPKVRVRVDGQEVEVREGDSAAAAVLAAGLKSSRSTAVSGSARHPYCMMGVCFECLMQIDGHENVQGCMTEVRPGMEICRQQGARLPGETAERSDPDE